MVKISIIRKDDYMQFRCSGGTKKEFLEALEILNEEASEQFRLLMNRKIKKANYIKNAKHIVTD